jgi:hypothetical protein
MMFGERQMAAIVHATEYVPESARANFMRSVGNVHSSLST